ncbi:MAG: fumarate hydratase C-terminal domain-containing protein, partial [Spirochaetales bacterium]|nr:fumarate hydratase C-terminal domain-containing protein [Spirochaetales bacterium]
MSRVLHLPFCEQELSSINCGDEVLISGILYVGRDQVHKRLFEAIVSGTELPFDFNGNAIYYMGPSPAPEGFAIGSKRYSYSDIKNLDASKWEKKGIITISGDGFNVRLDAWHHIGVKEFYEKYRFTALREHL